MRGGSAAAMTAPARKPANGCTDRGSAPRNSLWKQKLV